MAAVSCKSFIGAMSAESIPLCAIVLGALRGVHGRSGARIVRVHDVATTREMLRDSHRVVIGLGSNMGNSCEHIDDALASMRLDPDIWVGAVSEYVTSAPAYLEAGRTRLVNAVAVIQATLGAPGAPARAAGPRIRNTGAFAASRTDRGRSTWISSTTRVSCVPTGA